jgi:hypothetical protein
MRSATWAALATLAAVTCLSVPCAAERFDEAAARPAAREQRGPAASDGPWYHLVSSLDAREELLAAGTSIESGRQVAASDNHVLETLASLAVPGSGQLLKGHNRGYLYMLAEAALWGGFFVLDQKGTDERADYERFADENWDYESYSDWFEQNCSNCSDESPCGHECRPLAEYGTQEYYEDIGKYQVYWGWWNPDDEDVWPDYSDLDKELRDRYYEMRGDSNRHLRQARYAMMAAFLNHVVSALDAFLTSDGDGRDVRTSRGEGRDVHASRGARRDVRGYDDSLRLEFDVADGGAGLTCALVSRY